MDKTNFIKLESHKKLTNLSKSFKDKSLHLKNLVKNDKRLGQFSCKIPEFFFDYSHQRVTKGVMEELFALAKEGSATKKISDMASGKKVNTTENRAALHTATRNLGGRSIMVDGKDIMPDIKEANDKIKRFSKDIHTQKKFKDAVIIGIGGSYLGCQFVFNALKTSITPKIKLHFLSNVDIDNYGEIIKKIDPETCLWIVISKSYTTTETMANLNQAFLYFKQNQLDPAKHLVTITSKGSPGDVSSDSCLASFNMFDFIGGRFSVSSAVGGLPLSLAFGFDVFEDFLKGCHLMDDHALQASEEKNIPLTAALLGIWNSNFLDYPAQAIIPYCSALSKLAPHVQQLYMESLGKSVTTKGEKVDYNTGVIIFGEPGTNAQHSFFQLAHQGRSFPIEFIGVINPEYNQTQAESKGVSNHQELWANMIAQAQALAIGKDDPKSAKCFSGNRPSSTIIINKITPESIGMLLAFYEARTAFEGFLLEINPFDQFGVELGKVLASGIREHIAAKNIDVKSNNVSTKALTEFDTKNPITDFYLNTLFKGSL